MYVRVLPATAVAVLLLALAACSGGGSGSGDQAAKAISSALMKNNSGTLKLTQKQADCMGNGLVDKVGTDNLQKYGLLTKDLKANSSIANVKMSSADADAAAGVLMGCIDAANLLRNQVEAGQSGTATKQCLDKVLTDDVVRSVFAGIFSGDTAAATQKLTGPMTKCLMGAVPSS